MCAVLLGSLYHTGGHRIELQTNQRYLKLSAPEMGGFGMLFMPQPTDSAGGADLLSQAVFQGVGLRPTGWWVTPKTARLTHPIWAIWAHGLHGLELFGT